MNKDIKLKEELEEAIEEITSILIAAYPDTPPLKHMNVVRAIIGAIENYAVAYHLIEQENEKELEQ